MNGPLERHSSALNRLRHIRHEVGELVSDLRREEHPTALEQLLKIRHEFGELVSHLASNEHGWVRSPIAANGAAAPAERPSQAVLVRRYLKLRRQRDDMFPSGTFADPAWDIMLDLYASELEDRAISVSSACVASAVPPTTALRWINKLTEDGLLARTAAPENGRRIYIELTEVARQKVELWVAKLARM